MGLSAHNFSKHKLHFLELARDGLKTALAVLPLPFATSATGCYQQHEDSPLASTFATQAVGYRCDVFPQPHTLCAEVSTLPDSNSIDSIYSIQTCTPERRSVPNEKESSAQQHGCVTSPGLAKQEHPPSLATPMVLDSTHKDRLIKSLSTMHTFTDELVPSPLFSRSRKAASVIEKANNGGGGTPRPLPPLPFNHNVNFHVQGTRIVQIPKSTPVRKTAVQTLIARFEGSLPLPPSPTLTDSPWSPSPLTPRFQQIKEAFSPNPHNQHLETYLYSADLGRYNASLAEFRHQLRKHISFVDAQIHQVQAVQAEHATSKALTNNRLASFWSFEHASKNSASDRFRSTTKSAGPQENTDPKATAKRARIEKLRRNGWAVCKEDHGFKGEQYYENLRRIAERELDACHRLHSRIAGA